MKFLTKEILEKLPPLNGQKNNPDPIVWVKFFDPCNSWTWYATEGSPEENDFIFFGLVHGFEEEWGNFSLNELMSIKGPLGIGIERDIHFSPKPISKVKEATK